MIEVRALDLDGVLEITPARTRDNRGFFSETYKASEWRAAGLELDFVQDNHSYSAAPFTLRGLHAQAPPHDQHKLVRVIRGRVWDVAVDLRKGSASYGRWAAVELSAAKGNQAFVPSGFLHGFLSLEPDCEVLYKVTAEYAQGVELGVRWDDPDLAVAWPLGEAAPVLSSKDAALPLLAAVDSPFA